MTFDPEAFKAAAVHEVTADRYTALPVGDYSGTISKAEVVAGESNNGPWARLDVTVDIAYNGRTKPTRLGFMLDLDDSDKLDSSPNRNVLLGQIRSATRNNVAGKPFTYDMLIGHSVMVMIGHRPDKNDPEKVYETPKGWKAA